MAEERGTPLGDEIGYQVRFERKAGLKTRVLVMTEGLFIRRLQDDPLLEHVGAVLFDEFHERTARCRFGAGHHAAIADRSAA